LSIELRQADYGGALDYAQRNSFLAKSGDTQKGTRTKSHEIASVYLNFHKTLVVSRKGISFD